MRAEGGGAGEPRRRKVSSREVARVTAQPGGKEGRAPEGPREVPSRQRTHACEILRALVFREQQVLEEGPLVVDKG